jgi:NADH dehydrogenase FAD-containing subunit
MGPAGVELAEELRVRTPTLFHKQDEQEKQAESIKRTADIARAFRRGGAAS